MRHGAARDADPTTWASDYQRPDYYYARTSPERGLYAAQPDPNPNPNPDPNPNPSPNPSPNPGPNPSPNPGPHPDPGPDPNQSRARPVRGPARAGLQRAHQPRARLLRTAGAELPAAARAALVALAAGLALAAGQG
jgi:hypothetical protein